MDFRDITEFLKDAFKYIVVVFVILFIVIYIISFQQVMGPSMEPTLYEGNIIVVNKFVYRFNEIGRNEVVVLKHDEKVFIKRIIGLPGEYIEYRNNTLYINGEKYNEDNILTSTNDFTLTELGYSKVPDNMYLVLGDNRENSEDSREFGLIEKSDIVGKASIKFWPLNEIKFIK